MEMHEMIAALKAFMEAHAPNYVSAMADESQRTAYDEAMDGALAVLHKGGVDCSDVSPR